MSRTGFSLVLLVLVSAFSLGCGDSPAPKVSKGAEESTTTVNSEVEDDGLPEQNEPPVSAAIETVTTPDGSESTPAKAVKETAFDRLCEAYSSADADGWAAAEREILAAGHAATPTLVAALNDGAEHERELAASLLAQTGAISPQAKAALTKALKDESTFVRANAVAALCATGEASPEVFAVVEELLSRDDANSRMMAVASIGNLGVKAESLIPKVIELLNEEDNQLRQAAASALGQMGPKGKPALEKLQSIAADDPDEIARQTAVSAIALIKGEEPKAPGEESDSGTTVIPASSTKEVDK